jgi:hypothetical protein
MIMASRPPGAKATSAWPNGTDVKLATTSAAATATVNPTAKAPMDIRKDDKSSFRVTVENRVPI